MSPGQAHQAFGAVAYYRASSPLAGSHTFRHGHSRAPHINSCCVPSAKGDLPGNSSAASFWSTKHY